MAKCRYVDPETGERCQMNAQVLGDSRGWCINHDPALVEAKQEWSARGGRASRKVEPADVPSLRQLLADMEAGQGDDILNIKKVVIKSMSDFLEGKLSATQLRALCSSGVSTLKDVLALQMYRELTERVARLEAGDEPRQLEGDDRWQSRSEDY